MTKPGRLDRIDLKILAALQGDARITNQALADKVGLSPSPCLQRVKRLEQSGVLAGYLGRIALGRITHSVSVIATVSLESHAKDQFDQFEKVAAEPDSRTGRVPQGVGSVRLLSALRLRRCADL